jgi:hypothetical protein
VGLALAQVVNNTRPINANANQRPPPLSSPSCAGVTQIALAPLLCADDISEDELEQFSTFVNQAVAQRNAVPADSPSWHTQRVQLLSGRGRK